MLGGGKGGQAEAGFRGVLEVGADVGEVDKGHGVWGWFESGRGSGGKVCAMRALFGWFARCGGKLDAVPGSRSMAV